MLDPLWFSTPEISYNEQKDSVNRREPMSLSRDFIAFLVTQHVPFEFGNKSQ